MQTIPKVWAWWLLVAQGANAVMAALAYFKMMPVNDAAAAVWQSHAAVWHGLIGVALGTAQAFAKALPDADGNGVPDLFEGPKS